MSDKPAFEESTHSAFTPPLGFIIILQGPEPTTMADTKEDVKQWWKKLFQHNSAATFSQKG